jgi:cytochrome bd-type quinol oxidase subunit 1
MTQIRLRNLGTALLVAGVVFGSVVRVEPLRAIVVGVLFAVGLYVEWRQGNRVYAVCCSAFVVLVTVVSALIIFRKM